MPPITFREARKRQVEELDRLLPTLTHDLTAIAGHGGLRGPGPLFVGIGASLAAATAPVWRLRARGIEAYRLGAGDHPVPFPPSDRPVIGVSQSGRSPETLAVLTSVPAGLRYAVVNAQPSPLAEAADTVVSLGAIPDSYASTVGFTATVMALGLVADLWDGGMIDPGWAHLSDAIGSVQGQVVEDIASLVGLFDGAAWADVVGGGPSVGSAEVGALLLREVTRVPATAMSTRQYLHGAMESAGGGVHVLFGTEREAAVAGTLCTAGHRSILVTDQPVALRELLHVVRVPAVPPAQRALLEAVIMQTLVEALATARGIEIEDFVFHHEDTKVAVAARDERP